MTSSTMPGFHRLLHFVAVAPETITHNIGFLSNVLVAESTIDSLAEMLLFCIWYNTSEHAFALTYQARAPLRTRAARGTHCRN